MSDKNKKTELKAVKGKAPKGTASRNPAIRSPIQPALHPTKPEAKPDNVVQLKIVPEEDPDDAA